MTWAAVLLAAGGCYLLKLAGLSVPRRVLEHPRVDPSPRGSRWRCSPR